MTNSKTGNEKASSNLSNDASIDKKIEYTTHIIDTHFQTFNWLDVKMQALLAIAAASLAAAAFAVKDLPGIHITESIIIIFGCFLLIAGMITSLMHLVPILDSGVGNITNPRVAIVIANIENKDAYADTILNLKKRDMLIYNCHQIYGLATICKAGQKHLKIAIYFTGIGLIVVALTIFSWGVRTTFGPYILASTPETAITKSPPKKQIAQKDIKKQPPHVEAKPAKTKK